MTAFPPLDISTLHNIIKSYLYTEYNDDDALQAFIESFNDLAQDYLDYLNALNLPVYTSETITGDLLDWVAQGLYGISRPSLQSVRLIEIGPLNTYPFNDQPMNVLALEDPFGAAPQYYATSDDTFKRVITWHFFKGDGKVFNIRWLKRRIARFLFGTNGANFGTEETYRISVTFGGPGVVNINILSHLRTVTGGSMLNAFALNTLAFNSLSSTNVVYPDIPEGPVLKEAIESGALELPFQFSYNVGL